MRKRFDMRANKNSAIQSEVRYSVSFAQPKACIITAPQSGSGKTTAAFGIMRALAQRGYSVQPFKAGPDYLDCTWHTAAAGRSSYNLDTWMIASNALLTHFLSLMHGADIGIIEGVMGLYDGFEGTIEGSTAQLAITLSIPVVMIVDCSGMSGSVAPLVYGFKQFHPECKINGVILNNIASHRHGLYCAGALETIGLPIIGSIPRTDDLHLPHRHLGLVAAFDDTETVSILDTVAHTIESYVDLDAFISALGTVALLPESKKNKSEHTDREEMGAKGLPARRGEGGHDTLTHIEPTNNSISGSVEETACFFNGITSETALSNIGQILAGDSGSVAPNRMGLCDQQSSDEHHVIIDRPAYPIRHCTKSEYGATADKAAPVSRCRIAVAYDRVFHFYYQANLDMLACNGAELVYFSPLADAQLPQDIHGIYLGGGYPEEHVRELSDNSEMREAIFRFSSIGGCIYAECGGFMYLGRRLIDKNGQWPMCDVFHVDFRIKNSKRRMVGYREATLVQDTILGPRGVNIRGHEFHYSYCETCTENTTAPFRVKSRTMDESTLEGLYKNATLGSYLHIHFLSCPSIAAHFVDTCTRYKENKGV